MTPDPTVLSRRYATLVVAGLSIIVLAAVAVLVPVPYSTMKPGPAFNTLDTFNGKPLIAIKGVKTYPTNGALDFTTVSVSRANNNLSLFDAIATYLDSDDRVVPKSLLYPDHESVSSSDAEGAAQLSSSKDTSRVAALTAAGYTVPSFPTIGSVVAGGAAAGKLEAGDRVVSVDGTATSTLQQVVDAVGKKSPGDEITVVVTRKKVQQTVTLTAKADPQDSKKARIGVTLTVGYDFPVSITNNVDNSIGGPSAGTMFALAIYDKLTPGSLTGGRTIAGTGELEADGTVDPIGGVRQKMAGAHARGATIFLVPKDNCAEAAKGTDFGMTIVMITTLKGAISSLKKLAADPKATVPGCQ